MELSESLRIIATAFLTFVILKLRQKQKRTSPGKTIPGPCGLPFIGSFLTLLKAGYQPEVLMQKWRETYGNIFSFKLGSMTVVMLNNFNLINAAWHHPDLQGRDTPITASQIFGKGKGLVFAHGPEWKEHRRFILGMFRNFGIGKSSFEKYIEEEGNQLTDEIRRHEGKPMDVSLTYSMASCNIICKLIFSQQSEYNDPNYLKNLKVILDIFRLSGPGNLFNLIPFVAKLPFGIGQKIRENVKETKSIWQGQIDCHKNSFKNSIEFNDANDVKSNDITMEYLRRMWEEPTGEKSPKLYRDVNLIYVVRDLYLAGTETVATTMRWATLLLMTHLDVQEKCQREIDVVVGRDRRPNSGDRVHLPYLNATITEVQRVGNVVPLGLPHVALKDVILEGYYIPKGSTVMSNVEALMMDPELWESPEEFQPERHIDSNGRYNKPKEIIPFGTGKRICAGEQLARSELFLWLSSILHTFHILPPKNEFRTFQLRKGITGIVRLPHAFRARFVERVD